MSNISTLVRSARRARGLTQSELAERARVSQSRVSRSESGDEDPRFATADRLLAAAGHRLYSAPTRRDDAATAAEGIRGFLDAGHPDRALRQLIQLADDLNAEAGLVRAVLAVAEPGPTGHALWDAAIAGLVDWRLEAAGLPRPSWTSDPGRTLDVAAALIVDPADPEPSVADTPAAFVRHGVLAWPDTFASI